MSMSMSMLRLLRSVAAALALLAVAAACLAQGGAGTADKAAAAPVKSIRFGVLPLGGAVESRALWTPLLAGLSQAMGVPVSAYSVASYEELDRAIQRDEIDMAFLSAKMALDAVMQRRMKVVAQIARRPGMPTHRAVLLTRKAGLPSTLEAVLAEPERWRLARGDSRSVTGFLIPQSQLFLPRGIAMETRFRGEIVGTHQATALAVANGDADVATNNTTDFERFRSSSRWRPRGCTSCGSPSRRPVRRWWCGAAIRPSSRPGCRPSWWATARARAPAPMPSARC